ncbi:MAG: hypothetical protein Q9172_003138 [Xanthocarpia lactea]
MPPKRTSPRETAAQKKRRIAVPEEPQTPASELDDTTLVSDGDGFQSQIFTILVGLEEQSFTAHASFLSQSPVFDRMCHGQFEESRTFTIRLPDDKPNLIKAMIQYLYTGDFQDSGSVESRCKTSHNLAEMYGVAEKYQLKDLKTLIIKKLGGVVDVVQRPNEFMSTAKKIYDCIPNSDKDFRDFFRNSAIKSLRPTSMSRAIRQEFDEHVADGGIMAVDIVNAICSQYNAEIKLWETSNKTSQDLVILLSKENKELKEAKRCYKEDYERLKKSLNNWP